MSSTLRAPRGDRARAKRDAVTLASMTRRILGALIDVVLVLFVSGTMVAWLDSTISGVTHVRVVVDSGAMDSGVIDSTWAAPAWFPLAVFFSVMALYTIPLMALWGRTLGGWGVGIRCVRADTGNRPGWRLSVQRWAALYGVAGALSFVPVIGPVAWLVILLVGLSPLWDSTGRLRGYADQLAGDLVVRAPRPAAQERETRQR